MLIRREWSFTFIGCAIDKRVRPSFAEPRDLIFFFRKQNYEGSFEREGARLLRQVISRFYFLNNFFFHFSVFMLTSFRLSSHCVY